MRPLRNHLYAAGIPIENSKGEAETGQEELNISYGQALECADHHTIAKHATKEIAWANGRAASFLPKWHHDKVGSSSHVHQSLWKGDEPVFYDTSDALGMSGVMKHYMAGLLKYAPRPRGRCGRLIIARRAFDFVAGEPRAFGWSVVLVAQT